MPNVNVNLNFKLIRYLTIVTSVVALLFSFLLAGAWALDFGSWTRSIALAGPFPADEAAFVLNLQPTVPAREIFDSGGDTAEEYRRSNLRLTVDGVLWTRSHVLHNELRAGARQSFSHWGNSVYFSPGSDAAAPSRVEVVYNVSVKPILKSFILLGAFLSVLLRIAIAVKTGDGVGALRQLIRWWMAGVVGLSWGLLAFAALYFGSIIVALFLGYALPTSAIYRWFPGGDFLDRAMPLSAFPILLICASGVCCSWAAKLGIVEKDEIQILERRLIGFWKFAAPPVLIALLLLATSAGGWNGRFQPGGMTYQSIAGLVPYSDAQVYYLSAFDMLNSGTWNSVAAQRPLAASMRGAVTLVGGMSYVGSMVLQAVLLACALFFALRSLVLWQGIWVAGAFMALAFGLIQPYLTTSLTEPLGIIWSLYSFAFFIEAMRTRSTSHAIVGFAALSLALVTRMGSMFTIPFLMIWIVVAFAQDRRHAIRIGAILTGIVLMIMGLNVVLLEWFAPNAALAGNFSYVACGLGRGTDWSECALSFADTVKGMTLAGRNSFFYEQAAEAFWRDPSLLFGKVMANADNYTSRLPVFLLTQYTSVVDMSVSRAKLLACLCIPGMILVMAKNYFVLSFWVLLLASSILSAALIFGDDGSRVLIVTYVFLGGLFALGFASPAVVRRVDNRPSMDWRSGAAGIVAILFICVGSTLILQTYSRLFGAVAQPYDSGSVVQIMSSPGLTGFMVVPDGSPRNPHIPTVDMSNFKLIFERSMLLSDFGPVADEALEHMPFAVFIAPRRHQVNSTSVFVGPPELLTDQTTKNWDLDVRPFGSGPYLFYVQKATISPVKASAGPAG
ncbi:MAG: hypothetical protein WA943_13545 [Parvibaculum sp.]|uniref:hypothetical protein n=1 Tax=Parvibaculum sp. TaxID=2024848 RepID=UPI003C778BC2